jgi:hypothetical protein
MSGARRFLVTGPQSAAHRELTILIVTVVGLSRLLDGPLGWLVAGLLFAATVVGGLVTFGGALRGRTPIAATLVPAVVALGSVGAMRLVPLGLGLVPALAAVGLLLDRTLALEERLLRSSSGMTEDDRTLLLMGVIVAAFVGFVGAAALVPNGLVEPLRDASVPVQPLAESQLAALAIADALVAMLLGFRLATLRTALTRDAQWSAVTYGIVVAICAGALRVSGVPRLLGPALLTLVFFLWDAYHGAGPALWRDPRRLWEVALLAILGIVVVALNLQLRA